MSKFNLSTDEADSLYDLLLIVRESEQARSNTTVRDNCEHFIERLDELE